MSSARKRAAIQKANNEADHLLQPRRARKADALQARLDALMLEFCPEEMTEAERENWARHQRPASGENQAENLIEF